MKIKLTLIGDTGLEMQVLEQDESTRGIGHLDSDLHPPWLYSEICPALTHHFIFLRGTDKTRDNEPTRHDYEDATARQLVINKLKEAFHDSVHLTN